MSEAKARDLARAINQIQGWQAYPELRPLRKEWEYHSWWVQAQHDSMQGRGTVSITTWEEFELARMAWEGEWSHPEQLLF
jgi:hypothetical protein